MTIVEVINWNSILVQVLRVFFTGAVLGLLWSLGDFVGGWNKALSLQVGERISNRSFSWKRVAHGLFMILGMLLVASGFFFAIKFL